MNRIGESRHHRLHESETGTYWSECMYCDRLTQEYDRVETVELLVQAHLMFAHRITKGLGQWSMAVADSKEEAVVQLREQDVSTVDIAQELAVNVATVHRCLVRQREAGWTGEPEVVRGRDGRFHPSSLGSS